MTAKEIRQQFLDYFEEHGHKIVPSAPIVVKNDPTLMFVNAGMNQFKDIFLGNEEPDSTRVADTQKCIRVSGKHNDLEEVGIDSYHHTMFEMLGNWSFGDYFKQEAIQFAWELLVDRYGLNPDRMYATVFEGDEKDGTARDDEAQAIWEKYLPKGKILDGDKEDNFWEMGETGPCGPCSEIHYDLRSDADRENVPGKELVNKDHPLVIEIWNLVFIEFNRKADGRLVELPAKHVDTGMGLERIAMVVQGKTSNYETDLFMPYIRYIEKVTGIKYRNSYAVDAYTDIAMRVVVDHLRAVVFTIADGELPSNTGPGYVIRRILRRAIRYYYSYLQIKEPFIYTMLDLVIESFGDLFPEVAKQKQFLQNVIKEEEKSFLGTLSGGLAKVRSLNLKDGDIMDGETAFLLYDTYGFPLDLSQLIGQEEGWTIDIDGFEKALKEQKDRSKKDAEKQQGDWVVLTDDDLTEFVGYDSSRVEETHISKYRVTESKGKKTYDLVLEKTPFYAEGGGQVGDTGVLNIGNEKISVLNTHKENKLIVHEVKALPTDPSLPVQAVIDAERRALIENNHSATHLLHAALREVLGDHVQQKGSLLNEEYLRFDFSHFKAMTEEEIHQVENIVNDKIRANIHLEEAREIPLAEAQMAGAMMLFGEKYGDTVRMITFDPRYSRELCGGCHVDATGKIGLFKIISESSVSAGVRRIEALTGAVAERYIHSKLEELNLIKHQLKAPQHTIDAVKNLQEELKVTKNQLQSLQAQNLRKLKEELIEEIKQGDGFSYLSKVVEVAGNDALKSLAFELLNENEEMVVVLGAAIKGKAHLIVALSKELPKNIDKSAGEVIKLMSTHIQGGGGGQPFFANAGGRNPDGLDKAIDVADEYFGIKN